MNRIPLYTDLDNLAEIYSMDRIDPLFFGMNQLISKESELIFCEDEETAMNNELFEHVSKELATGNFVYRFRNNNEEFLTPAFKTNLQERFENKSSIFFSYDNDRVSEFKSKNGILMAGVGEEHKIYHSLNYNRTSLKGFRFIIPDENFSYDSLKPYILPFTDILINEPYLFQPDRNDWNIERYIENNFKKLIKTLFENRINKINIIIATFVNEDERLILKFPYLDPNMAEKLEIQKFKTREALLPLYNLCKTVLNSFLGAGNYNLSLLISPTARTARHDRYILTNYQYIECGGGFAFFDDRGNYVNRTEKIEMFSVLDDQTRMELIPSIQNKFKNVVVDSLKANSPYRIYKSDSFKSNYFDI
jgi:hypothetical protein